MRKVVSRLYIHFRLTPLWSDGGYSKILVLPRPRLYHHMMYCAAQKSGISVLFVLSGDHRELTKIVPYQIRSCSLILIFTVVSFQIIWASIFKSENHYKKYIELDHMQIHSNSVANMLPCNLTHLYYTCVDHK